MPNAATTAGRAGKFRPGGDITRRVGFPRLFYAAMRTHFDG
jgi:hypothetical protein